MVLVLFAAVLRYSLLRLMLHPRIMEVNRILLMVPKKKEKRKTVAAMSYQKKTKAWVILVHLKTSMWTTFTKTIFRQKHKQRGLEYTTSLIFPWGSALYYQKQNSVLLLSQMKSWIHKENTECNTRTQEVAHLNGARPLSVPRGSGLFLRAKRCANHLL